MSTDDIHTLEKTLKRNPNDQDTLVRYAMALKKARRIPDAITALHTVVSRKPHYWLLHYNLGTLFEEATHIPPSIARQHAFQHYSQCIQLKPDFAMPYNNYAVLLSEFDKSDEALKLLQTAVKLKPDFIEAWCSLAKEYINRGEFDKAREAYEEVLRIDPDVALAYNGLAFMHKYTSEDQAQIDTMEALYKRLDDQAVNEKSNICFALGKVYDDLKEYDKAWQYFEEGNKLLHHVSEQAYQSYGERAQNIKKQLNAEFFKERREFGLTNENPVFILGLPRCGSSLTERILSSHPKIDGAGELTFLGGIIEQLPMLFQVKEGYPTILNRVNADVSQKLAGKYLEQVQHRLSAPDRIFVDKGMGNYFYLGLIMLMFPNAQLIHCARNPVDTMLSMYMRKFASGQQLFAYSWDSLIFVYSHYLDLMRHWHEVLPVPIYDSQYERLVQEPEVVTTEIFDFLGMDAGKENLENAHLKSDARIRTASGWQARQPIYTSSMQKWRKYEKHLSPWLEQLEELIQKAQAVHA